MTDQTQSSHNAPSNELHPLAPAFAQILDRAASVDASVDRVSEQPGWLRQPHHQVAEIEEALAPKPQPDWLKGPLPADMRMGNPRWEKGVSGNPLGKPKGTRNKLSEDFIAAMHEDFEDNGKDAIAKVREKMPHRYLQIIASLLPKELKVDVKRDLTDDQLDNRIRQLASILEIGAPGAFGGAEASAGSQQIITIQSLPEAT
jgi:hypothetical protein